MGLKETTIWDFKMRKFILMITMIIVLFIPMKQNYVFSQEKNDKGDVVILYDQLAMDTQYAGNLIALENVLTAQGKTMMVLNFTDYSQGMMNEFSRMIILKNSKNDIINTELIDDFRNYSGEIMYIGQLSQELIENKAVFNGMSQSQSSIQLFDQNHTFSNEIVEECHYINENETDSQLFIAVNGIKHPFSKKNETIQWVPLFLDNASFQICLGDAVKTWFSNSENNAMMTVVIPNIYPFSDLMLLVETTNKLYEYGIPFTVGIVPVTENIEYPAMQNYYQVLRYAQSKNGSIVIHQPDQQTTNGIIENSNTIIDKEVKILIENGIYPLGIIASEEMLFTTQKEDNLLSSFSSGVIIQNDNETIIENKSSWGFEKSSLGITMQQIDDTRSNTRRYHNYGIDTTIIIDLSEDLIALDGVIERLNYKWMKITDFKEIQNQWEIGDTSLYSDALGITINGMGVSLSYNDDEIIDDYDYQEKQQYSLEKIFNAGNRVLLIFVGLIIIVFIGILLLSRWVYLNKFRKKIKKKDKEKNKKDDNRQ
jgi:hypothetical protein